MVLPEVNEFEDIRVPGLLQVVYCLLGDILSRCIKGVRYRDNSVRIAVRSSNTRAVGTSIQDLDGERNPYPVARMQWMFNPIGIRKNLPW
jgi:hypothetical protein